MTNVNCIVCTNLIRTSKQKKTQTWIVFDSFSLYEMSSVALD